MLIYLGSDLSGIYAYIVNPHPALRYRVLSEIVINLMIMAEINEGEDCIRKVISDKEQVLDLISCMRIILQIQIYTSQEISVPVVSLYAFN